MKETKENHKIVEIPWSDSIWFLDIDDTIVDSQETAKTASLAVSNLLQKDYGADKSEKIRERSLSFYNLLLKQFRATDKDNWGTDAEMTGADNLLQKIRQHQKSIIEQDGQPRIWSRELFIYLAAIEEGITLSRQQVHQAANDYWERLTDELVLFPGARLLFQQIGAHQRPVYLVTGSENRLQMRSSGQFDYFPEYSEKLRRERLQKLREKGILFRDIIVGDPVDKPERAFFEKALKVAASDIGPVNLSWAIMIGDSFIADCKTPKEMGFGLVVIFEKNRYENVIVDPHHLVTGDLSSVTQHLIA